MEQLTLVSVAIGPF